MGPEELAIITNPQFINTTFRAGENWYHGMVNRAREAEALAQRRNSFEAANAQFTVVNRQLLEGARQQNEKWKNFANDLVRKHDEYAVLARRLLDERTELMNAEWKAKLALEREMVAEKSRSAEKDKEIAQLKHDRDWFQKTLTTTHEAMIFERQNSAMLQAENENLIAALNAAEADILRLRESKSASEG